MAFDLPIKPSSSQPTSFFTFTLLILPAVLLGRERLSSCVVLGSPWGLKDNTAEVWVVSRDVQLLACG